MDSLEIPWKMSEKIVTADVIRNQDLETRKKIFLDTLKLMYKEIEKQQQDCPDGLCLDTGPQSPMEQTEEDT